MLIHDEGSLESVKAILDGAGIDYIEQGEEAVYVTGLAFNFWIFVQPERSMIDIMTYEMLPEGMDEVAALRCVNALNQKFILAQFSLSECGKRLYGRYMVSCREGLPAPVFLWSARLFSSVFNEALLHTCEHAVQKIH
jgi:hypothetical protein